MENRPDQWNVVVLTGGTLVPINFRHLLYPTPGLNGAGSILYFTGGGHLAVMDTFRSIPDLITGSVPDIGMLKNRLAEQRAA